MHNQPPLTQDEIAAAVAHYARVATPEMVARMETPDAHGRMPGDDPAVIRAWAKRANSNEGLAALFFPKLLADEARPAARTQPRRFAAGDTSRAAIAQSFYTEQL